MMKEISEQSQKENVEIVTDEDESSSLSASSSNLFSLKWNGFEEQVCNGFASLLYSGDLADVTLACDGQLVKAHKVVLAMCSPFFRKIFSENPCKHPIVIIKGIKFREVKNVLHFIYLGEVRVQKHEINEFFEAADSLKIDGLDCEPDFRRPPSQNDLMDKDAPSTSSRGAYGDNRYEKRETENYSHHSSRSYERQSTTTTHGRYESDNYPANAFQMGDGSEPSEGTTFDENIWSTSHVKRSKSSSNVDDVASGGGAAASAVFSPKAYRTSSTMQSSDAMQSSVDHSETHGDEVDLSTHRRRDNPVYNPRHHAYSDDQPNSRSLPDYEHSSGDRSTSAEREYASSLPEVGNTVVSPGVIMSSSVTRPSRNDFEPKWESARISEIPATAVAPPSSPSITNPSESFTYRSTTSCVPPHYSSPRFTMSAQQQNDAANFSLGLGLSSTTGQGLSIEPHVLPLVPVSLSLSCQPSSSASAQISPAVASSSQSHYSPSSGSKPTSTLSALRAKISSGLYPSSQRGFRSYYQGTATPLTGPGEGGDRPIGVVSRRAELPNPKTKQIRSSQVPPSSRYTATEVDAMVDQVQHYPGNLVPCALCQKVVKRERLRAHIHECHLLHGERIICPHCGIGLKSKGSFRVHIWRHKRGTLSSRLHPH